MKTGRRIAAFAALLALTLLLPLEAGAQANPRYWLQVVGDDGTVVTSGYCRPLNAGLNTEPTIYTTDSLATAKSIPITINATTGECDWYQTRGRTYDVMVYVTGGNYKGSVVRMDTFTGVGKAVVSRSHGAKVLVTPFATSPLGHTTASERIPAGAFVYEVVVETKTAVTGSLFNVGLVSEAWNALCASISTGTVTWQDCLPTRRWVHTAAGLAITYNNQNHASAGYIHTYFKTQGNEP